MRRLRAAQLKQAIPCGYCFEEWASCYDHILPVKYGGSNKKSNLYPSCQRCNGILSAKVFGSLDEKRDYIREELKRREEWHTADEMQKLRESLPAKASVADIL